jgi:hypothetical protein
MAVFTMLRAALISDLQLGALGLGSLVPLVSLVSLVSAPRRYRHHRDKRYKGRTLHIDGMDRKGVWVSTGVPSIHQEVLVVPFRDCLLIVALRSAKGYLI